MEMAKVTSKGQITIPVSIRKRLGINEGDKILFIDSPDGVIMVNPDMLPGGGQAAEPRPAIVKTTTPSEPATRVNVKPRVIPPAATQAPAEPTAKEESRAKGLDVGALLDEIRSIGTNTLK